jgi:hypothetical protein
MLLEGNESLNTPSLQKNIDYWQKLLQSGETDQIALVKQGVARMQHKLQKMPDQQRRHFQFMLEPLEAKLAKWDATHGRQLDLIGQQQEDDIAQQIAAFEKQKRKAQRHGEFEDQRAALKNDFAPQKNSLKLQQVKTNLAFKQKQRELNMLRQKKLMGGLDEDIDAERMDAQLNPEGSHRQNPWRQKLVEAANNGRYAKYTRPLLQGYRSALESDLQKPDYKEENDPYATNEENDKARVFNKNLKGYSKADRYIAGGASGLGNLASSLGGNSLKSSLAGAAISHLTPKVWNMAKNYLANRNVEKQLREEREKRRYKHSNDLMYERFGVI